MQTGLDAFWERLAAGGDVVRDVAVIALYGALFFLAGKATRWWLRRRAKLAQADGGAWERELLSATRRVLTPALTLAGVYIAMRTLARRDESGRWKALPLELATGFLYVIVLVLGVWVLIRLVKVWLGWYRVHLVARHLDPDEARHAQPVLIGVERALKLVLVAGAVLVAMRHFRQDVSSLMVSLGLGSLALGLAAQDTLANMLAGFMILMDRPFTVGDRIQLSTGEIGDVTHIGFRRSDIRLPTGALLSIANRELAQQRLINLSGIEGVLPLRVTLEFLVPIALDEAALREIALGAAAPGGAGLAAEPKPDLKLTGLDGARRYALSFSAHDARHRGEAYDTVARALLAGLAKAGIPILASQTAAVSKTP